MNSKNIDERVVEMRFDNKQFEANAKETIGTLSRLKNALKLPDTTKALEGIDKATKNISLDGIAAGVEALNDRFSTLGIVGMRVISNITDALMNKLNAAVNFVTNSIVSGGVKRAMNIENAHFQLQALLKDEVKVQAVMADAMESVDGTAYAYDEAAKAASQFAASGIQAGEEMLGALKGITGVAAMTNSRFEDISRIFTTVAGNGRLMGDQLLQLSSRGLNVASTLADYFREVRGQTEMTEGTIRDMVSRGMISFKDFSDAMTWAFGDSAKRANETFTGSMSNMKSALARIGADFVSPLVEQNGELIQLFNALRIKINDVRSALRFDEQRSAISGLSEVTKITKDELSEMFATIKKNNKVTISDLDKLSDKGADATTALTKYVNGVTDGSVRASYAITKALGELTEGTKVSNSDIRKFVEEGKIDLSTFTYAMETEFGNEKTLVKQFTDFFLDKIGQLVDAVNSLDVTKPMEIFYYWVESIKNVAKGLFSILKPAGKAFSETFIDFNADDIIKISSSIEELTSKMKLSEKGSKNLHDAMKGIFDVAKLFIDILFELLGAIVPINKPIIEMGGGLLDIAGSIGRLLTSITKFIRSSTKLRKFFNLFSSIFSKSMKSISSIIKNIKYFIKTLSELPGTSRLINAIGDAFNKLSKKSSPYIEKFIRWIENLFDSLFELKTINIDGFFNAISKSFSGLASVIEDLNFDNAEKAFEKLIEKIKSFSEIFKGNDGISSVSKNFKDFSEDLKNALSFEGIFDRVEKIMEIFGKFFRWIRNTFSSAFEEFNVGSTIAGGAGIALIVKTLNILEKFSIPVKTFSDSFKNFSGIFGSLKDTLVAYQKNIKAGTLLKIAGAIAIFAGSLLLLSFADPERLVIASIALSIVSGVLLTGISKLLEATNKGKELNDSLKQFSEGFKSSMKKLGTAAEIKAIGSSIKDFAKSIATIALSIIALGIMWKKDRQSFYAGLIVIGAIGSFIVGVGALMFLASKFTNSRQTMTMASIGKAMLSLSASMILVVYAIKKLMELKIPNDYQTKLEILNNVFVGLASLIAAIAIISKFMGKEGKIINVTKTVGSLAVLLFAAVYSLSILFSLKLPNDYKIKLGILGGIFTAFAGLIIVMAEASKISKGKGFNAASTILSMAAFLVAVTGSLLVLSIIPGDKLLKGTIALGAVLIALGASLSSAGKLTDKKSWRTVLSMAAVIGAITVSLAVLSMVPWKKLLNSSVSLGLVLWALSKNFDSLSKVRSSKAILSTIAMIGAIIVITRSLVKLSKQPWDKMLSAAGSMSITLLAFSKSFQMILSKTWSKNNAKKIGTFLVLTFATMTLGHALAQLSKYPWDGMLGAAGALSLTVFAFSEAFKNILEPNWSKNNAKKIGTFLLLTLSALPLGHALGKLSKYPWDGMLGAAGALSLTVFAFSEAFKNIIKQEYNKSDIKKVVNFVLFTFSALPIGHALAQLSKYPWDGMLGAAGALSLTVFALGTALSIISKAKINFGAVALMILASGSLILIAKAISSLAEYDQSKLLASCLSMSAMLVVVLGIATIFGGASALLGYAMVGILALGALIAELAIVLAAIGGLAQIPGLKWLIEEGGDLLQAVGTAIGQFIGGIIGGVIGGITSQLPQVGLDLSAFMVNLTPFILGAKLIDAQVVAGVGFLSATIIALTAAEVINGIGSLFGLSLVDLAIELSNFMIALSPFIISSRMLKEENMKACAYLGTMIISLTAAEVINGIGRFFGLTGKLSDFGAELVAFGPSIRDFADTVKDVKPEAVQGAASAAQIMSEMTKGLPNSGGFAAKVLGDNKLSDFGAELEAFGPHIVGFSNTVKDVKPEAVQGAASAAQIMSDLATKLPNAGGFAAQILGDNTLSEFGEELKSFGPDIVDFANTVKDIVPTSVNGAAYITSIMSTLAENLPNTDTLYEKIFGGGNISLSEFGDELYDFGYSMADFSEQIGEVNVAQINNAIDSFNSLISLANSSKDADTSSLLNFAYQLSQMSTEGVDKFIETFSGAGPRVSEVLTNLSTEIITTLTTISIPLQTSAMKLGDIVGGGVQNGILNSKKEILSSCSVLCILIISEFQNNLTESKFRTIGANAAIGLKYGIESKIDEIADAAISAAQAAIDQARATLDEHSPSKVFFGMGKFVSLGLANGIISYIKYITEAGTKAGEGAIDPVKKSVDGIMSIIDSDNFNVNPVIRPVMDISDVQKGASEISSLMNKTYDLSSVYNKVMDTASTFNKNKNNRIKEEDSKLKANEEYKYEFNQYNYSPKALSRSEIYRQTNNQFSAFRKAVNPS